MTKKVIALYIVLWMMAGFIGYMLCVHIHKHMLFDTFPVNIQKGGFGDTPSMCNVVLQMTDGKPTTFEIMTADTVQSTPVDGSEADVIMAVLQRLNLQSFH